jgi:hypothetical protein
MNRDAGGFHQLAGANLGALAQLLRAVNGNYAGGDQRFASRAAVGDAHDFEQIVQINKFVVQREVQDLDRAFFHGAKYGILGAWR